ncbi:FxSxx-COOH system tetratricopeptide repeat protein [Amycolatopsis sp. H20-H5]|uniref:FxSxx-COOH system tetratricopeptide repeat protein n=1 Tax=Amycolatopsis sp. H20-H5 TaxID=3046309 RepID=UPI002DBE4460|nr:FxSxx-COOH system tetratricopeptide repeat protein [Amycolatopsis sp. H20-H5]MEC3974340.1 FxSxx-COOH system tetratricopeptide repeat protein [Amycolatopsis sp. H20-H5]
MNDPLDHTPPAVANTITGDVAGVVVQAGTVHDVHIHPPMPARPVVTPPYRYGTFPPRAASFQHRSITLDLAAATAAGHTAMLTSDGAASTSVVSGLGGVGKTQLALDYAETAWAGGEVDLLVWITATSRDALVSDYARLAADLTGTDDPDPEQGARRLLAWLATADTRWLVVLDDVQTPADLRGLWPPATPCGQVVVTTRRRDAALRGHGRRLIEIDVFASAEAVGYLIGALSDQQHLLDEVSELAADLGFLPLALAQAAAFMLDRNLSCAGYRERLADWRHQLAGLVPEPESLPDEYRATVAATWSLSIEQANQLEPTGLAGVVLEVASVLDANGIPIELFTAPSVLALLTEATGREVDGKQVRRLWPRRRRRGREVDAEQARDGVGCAHRLSLLSLASGSTRPTVRVHALVQRVTRDTVPADRLPILVRAVADALASLWPQVERDTVVGQMLRANAEAVTAVGGAHLWHPDGHPVLFRVGSSLGEAGLVRQARDYFARMDTAATRNLGPDHPDTLTIRNNHAYWRGRSGDPAGAAAACMELLADRLRVLGPDHPNTLTTRSNLAYLRGETGDATGAAAAFEDLLADRLRVLGPDHPNTLATRNNVAHWCGEAGDPAGAAAAYVKLLADRLRVLGPDHPDTLSTVSNLAYWRGETGDPAGAAAAFEELLADRLRVLGPDHPDTLSTVSNLAYWRGEAGNAAGAAAAFENVLADRLRVLGPDHPDTLAARANLAHWRGRAGDPAGAAAAYVELLADRLRVLSADHPDTLATSDELAHWQKALEDSPSD